MLVDVKILLFSYSLPNTKFIMGTYFVVPIQKLSNLGYQSIIFLWYKV